MIKKAILCCFSYCRELGIQKNTTEPFQMQDSAILLLFPKLLLPKDVILSVYSLLPSNYHNKFGVLTCMSPYWKSR
jgi:hypothetical protein